jgi:hypothetical protein
MATLQALILPLFSVLPFSSTFMRPMINVFGKLQSVDQIWTTILFSFLNK